MAQQLIEPNQVGSVRTEALAEPPEIYVHDSTANPAPLGLMGFGLTTLLLNIHNAGFTELDSMILAMGIFYGGLAQVIAGLVDFRKGSEFGATAFTSYGLFWLSLVALVTMENKDVIEGPSSRAMGWYLFTWGVFTAIMLVGALRTTRALQLVFLSLATLFFLLAIGDWTGNETITKIAGWEGIFTAIVAIYTATAQIWNDVYGKVMLPLGPVAKE